MKTRTLLAFPAAHWPDPDEIPVTLDEDSPTEPRLSVPERPTERPSGEAQAALVEASREPPAWLGEPLWAVDPTSGRLVLTSPYSARQLDDKGNTFVVECFAGLEVSPPATAAQARAIRTALVAAALRVSDHAWIHRGGAEIFVPLDDQWRREIVTAFREGDAGVRLRG